MKKVRATMAIMLAAAILFCACQSSTPPASSSSAESSSALVESSSADASSSEAPEGAGPVLEGSYDLSVELFDRGVAGQLPADKSFHTDWIRENFAKEYPDINISYVLVPRAQENDKLNILMASGEAPDVCLTYNSDGLYNFVKQGGITELTDLLVQYGPNLQTFLADSLPYGVFDGKQYAIPAKRVNLARHGSYIRKDWLDKVGLPVPSTTEEFYETMVAFKEQDPGGFGSANIPFAINADFNNAVWPFSTIMDSFITEMSDEDFYCLPIYLWPGFKDSIRFMNKMYNNDLINLDFPLDNDKTIYKELIAQGKVGAFINNTGFPLGNGADAALTVLKQNVPGAELTVMDPFVNYEGKTRKATYEPVGIYTFVPSFSKVPEAAMVYVDWISRDDNRFFLQNGEEGVHYEMIDGLPIPLDVPDEDPRKMSPTTIDVTLTTNGQDLGDSDLNARMFALTYADKEQSDLYEQEYALSIKDGYLLPRFDRPIEAQMKYVSVLRNFESELVVKSIAASEADFDKVFDALIEEYLSIGAQEVIDEKRIAYAEMID